MNDKRCSKLDQDKNGMLEQRIQLLQKKATRAAFDAGFAMGQQHAVAHEAGIQTFSHASFGTVRTVEQDGKVLFCGRDVATALGYTNTNKALADHCKSDGVTNRYPICDSLGRTQEARFITEGDVYRLITHSRLPAAEQFERWVFDEVLPEIRKTGGYGRQNAVENELLNQILENQKHILALLKARNTAPKQLVSRSMRGREMLVASRYSAYQSGLEQNPELRKLILSHCKNYSEFALRMGWWQAKVHKLLCGQKPLYLDEAQKIAGVLNVSVDAVVDAAQFEQI